MTPHELAEKIVFRFEAGELEDIRAIEALLTEFRNKAYDQGRSDPAPWWIRTEDVDSLIAQEREEILKICNNALEGK